MMVVVVVMMMVNVAKRLECGWEGVINCTSKPETVRTWRSSSDDDFADGPDAFGLESIMRAILYLLHIHSHLFDLTFIVVTGVTTVALKMIDSRSKAY